MAGMGFGANLRSAVFSKIQDFSFANIDRFSTPSLITRMTTDINTIQMGYTMVIRIVIRYNIKPSAGFQERADRSGNFAVSGNALIAKGGIFPHPPLDTQAIFCSGSFRDGGAEHHCGKNEKEATQQHKTSG
jgi:hypothetical protein